jgi:aminomethyltransferase
MTRSWRHAVLADRHRALGSNMEDWNGMPTAWSYNSDVQDHHVAIRTKAGLMDVSGLKKVHLHGPHASGILDWLTTRDVSKIYPGKSAYTCFLNEAGKFIDDGILYRTGPNSWFVIHGSGDGHAALSSAVVGRNVSMIFDDDLLDLSLQGPLAVDFLAQHVPGIRDLKYFHHVQTTLFGKPVMISRTGYTGERGYEIFCKSEDAHLIWDTILAEGAAMGIIPCCFTALDLLRTESYLLFYPYDNSQMYPFANEAPGDTLWELGLDFTVSPRKTGFRGAEEHYRLKGKERFKIQGVLLEGMAAAAPGDKLFADDKTVGVITCPMVSTLTQKSMAIARIDTPYAAQGTKFTVENAAGSIPAVAHKLPFDDPQKSKRTVSG